MYSADSLTTHYVTDPIAVYRSLVKRNKVIIDNTVSYQPRYLSASSDSIVLKRSSLIWDMLTVYMLRGQGKLGAKKQHIKLINQDLHSLRLT